MSEIEKCALDKAEDNTSSPAKYVRYKRRWYMLAVVMMFNISNAIVWISYAPVANVATVYYNVSEMKINWFSLVFFACSVIFGLPAFWIIDSLGLRTGVLTGTWCNAVGSALRVLASYVAKGNQRYWVALTGQILSGSSQPLVLSMPTKLAALWFGDNERTIANTFASLANPLGVLIASVLAPSIADKPDHIPLMLIVFSIPSCLAAIMATVGFCSSTPPTPPSASAEEESQTFFKGIKQVFNNKAFLVLMTTFGIGVAMFSVITTLLEQIVCPRGYNNDIAGLCGALVIVGGLIGSAIASIYCDKTKNYEEIVKVMSLFGGLSGCGVLIVTSVFDQTALLAICFFFFGATLLGVAPIFLELGVECTYPVAEATSSGLQWMAGQFVGVFLMVGMPMMGRSLTPEEKQRSRCDVEGTTSATKVKAVDLGNAVLLGTVMTIAVVLFFVLMFRTDYRRLNAEREREKNSSQSRPESLHSFPEA